MRPTSPKRTCPGYLSAFTPVTRCAPDKSTGLGLAIVKALAQRMGHTAFAQLENGVFTVGVRWHMYR